MKTNGLPKKREHKSSREFPKSLFLQVLVQNGQLKLNYEQLA